jgi:hypothetical protein
MRLRRIALIVTLVLGMLTAPRISAAPAPTHTSSESPGSSSFVVNQGWTSPLRR